MCGGMKRGISSVLCSRAEPGCTWTARSNSPWITITGASGMGTGTVTYTVAQYVGKPKKRNGSMTVAGHAVTIQQSR
jgi:hypothetical protein